MLSEVDELFKTYIPYYILVFLPIFIIVSPTNPVSASYEFPAYRMQHYDLHGVPYGSRVAAINLEARSLSTWSSSRHCIVTRLTDLTYETFSNVKNKVGALVLALPENLTNFTAEKQQHLILENKIVFDQETQIPVYFVKPTKEFNGIITELASNIDTNDKKKSATEALFGSVAANGYQIVISASTPSVQTNNKIATIHGYLQGSRSDSKVPTIVIVAYYDSFGIAPDLSYGVDSNGSGLIVLLELVRIFSTLYSHPSTRGKYNIVFVLTGGGKFNYQGSKKWLEDQLDAAESSLIQDAAIVMCLDTLATSDTMFMHVSKPPKEGSAASIFFKHLKATSEKFPGKTVEGVHKKINLAEDILAWEHERYSIRRLPAFTLSAIKHPKDPWRFTVHDNRDNLKTERLIQNAQIVVETVGKFVFNLSEGDSFNGNLDVSKANVENWLKSISNQPRSAQLLTNKDNGFVSSLQHYLNKYLQEVKVTYAVADKRDPDYQFYGSTQATMNIYRVKPAVFDLILTLAITTYLGAVYFAISYIPSLYSICSNLVKNKKDQ